MSKFSPGPWQVGGVRMKYRSTGNNYVLDSHAVGPDSDPVCLVFYYDKYHSEHIANARLIAAAPELLEALETLVKRIREDGMDGKERYWDITNHAREVIEKARAE